MLSLLTKLRQYNISLWQDGQDLALAFGNTAPPAELIAQLKANKPQLLSFLTERGINSQAAFNQMPEFHRYPLSFAQQRLWFIEKMTQGSELYHIPLLIELEADADITKLAQAINAVVDKHQVLRSVYVEAPNGEDYQQVLAASLALLSVEVPSQTQLWQVVRQEVARAFDLTTELPMRAQHYVVANQQKSYLLLLWHHIAFDGWSVGVFFRDLKLAYGMADSANRLPQLAISYGDYAKWQKQHHDTKQMQQQQDYWLNKLGGFESLALLTDKPRPSEFDDSGAKVDFKLSEDLTYRLRQLAKAQQTTLFNLTLTGFKLTLSLLTGQQDIVIGMPSDNRELAQTQDLIGFFVNSLVLRNQFSPDQTLATAIANVQQTVIEAKSNQDLPFEHLVELLQVERSFARHPIFQVMFGLEASRGEINQLGLPFVRVEQNNQQVPAKFDLDMMLLDCDSHISGKLIYASSLFEASSVENMVSLFEQSLNMMTLEGAMQSTLSQLPWVSQRELHEMAKSAAQNTMVFQQQACVIEHVMLQAKAQPQAIALRFNHTCISYGELMVRVDNLAMQIQQSYGMATNTTLAKDCLIALYFEPSAEMIISILAVLRCGAAFVPISPEHPQQRFNYIMQDTKAAVVLSHQALALQLDEYLAELDITALGYIPQLVLADSPLLQIKQPSNVKQWPSLQSNDLAYVIYTSGTTGQPKGVMIERGALSNLVASQTAYYGFNSDEVCALLSNYIFDAALEPLFLTLCNGGTLVLPDKALLSNIESLRLMLVEQQITHLDATPGYLALVGQLDVSHHIRRVVSGGDVGGERLKSVWGRRLINVYGPTETTITALYSFNYGTHPAANCIGRPVANTQVHVLSPSGQLLPTGAIGELYITGAGLARGYLNRDDLTAKAFVEKDLGDGQGLVRLYKTGDQVRRLADGNFEFLGRNDSQVKIRGFRVELGEIENAIEQLQIVEQAVVVDVKQGEQLILAAYLRAKADCQTSKAQLKDIQQQLQALLPSHMVPTSFNWLAQIPLTVNGKVDRKALPQPQLMKQQGYVAPRNELESQLCDIFAQMLNLERFGIEDNFFDAGGNSLLVLKLIGIIKQQLGLDYDIKRFYRAATIAKLVEQPQAVKPLVLSELAILPADIQPHVALNHGFSNTELPNHILLTGATGFVGRYMLAQLLNRIEPDSGVDIYCLVRGADKPQALERIVQGLKDYGIWKEQFSGRILPILGDLAQVRLGINDKEYSELSLSVGQIYHCATYMDHLATFEQMKTVNVEGVNQLLRFVCAKRQKSLEFLSTTGVFNYSPNRVVTEYDSIDDEQHFDHSGYVSTKWVGEKLIQLAIDRGFIIKVHRLGLVTGDAQSGKNDPSQWFGKLISSCQILGCCFDDEAIKMAITPVDQVVRAIDALASSPKYEQQSLITHLDHPQEMAFVDLVKIHNAHSDPSQQIECVSFIQFIQAIKQAKQQGQVIPIEYMFSDFIQQDEAQLTERLAEQQKSSHGATIFDTHQTRALLKSLSVDFIMISDRQIARYFHLPGNIAKEIHHP